MRGMNQLIIELLLVVPRLYIFIDGLLSRVCRGVIHKIAPPKYPVMGSCKERGVCCRNIAVYLSSGFWKFPVLRNIAIAWYQHLYNFSYKGADAEAQVVVFECKYLKKNMCSIHWRRPFICRNYPQPDLFKKRTFIPGCGYFIRKD